MEYDTSGQRVTNKPHQSNESFHLLKTKSIFKWSIPFYGRFLIKDALDRHNEVQKVNLRISGIMSSRQTFRFSTW
jgi:hypothetical protein